jgi:hypothetical protein
MLLMQVEFFLDSKHTKVTRRETSGEIRGNTRSETTGVTRGETSLSETSLSFPRRRFLHQGKKC